MQRDAERRRGPRLGDFREMPEAGLRQGCGQGGFRDGELRGADRDPQDEWIAA